LVTSRRGASSLGCLFSLLIFATAVYFAVNIGEVYWRFYEFQDDMQQEVRFASSTTNERILLRLKARADSLDLPDDAHDITIKRSDKAITIEAEYYDRIQLPLYVREVLFRPHAEGTL
jgi:hypothetical protein